MLIHFTLKIKVINKYKKLIKNAEIGKFNGKIVF